MAAHDQVRLILNSHQLDKSISLPFLQRDRLTPERFLAAIERVVQSNDQFTLDDSVSVNVVHVEMPNGAGRKRRDVVNLESFLRKKDCIVVKAKKRQTAEEGNDLLDDDVAVENDVEDTKNLMFFDFECTQHDGKHIPNRCAVQNEHGDEKVFSGSNTKDEFCTWVFQQENANTTFVAHNFQAYDGYFILQYLYKNGITPEIITRGAKIISLTVSEMNIKL